MIAPEHGMAEIHERFGNGLEQRPADGAVIIDEVAVVKPRLQS
jgi:hypothetical protein